MGVTPEVQAERERCAAWCEHMAVILLKNAAAVRADGTYTGRSLWPPLRKTSWVHHNWERVALQKEDAASAVRKVKEAILDGWVPKDGH